MSIERRAFKLAIRAHRGQAYGKEPYVVHLFDVVQVLRGFLGTLERNALPKGMAKKCRAAAWLHDVIEDTPANYHDVEDACGMEVAEIVYALTDELGRSRKERKAKTLPKVQSNLPAQLVKLSDWIANVENCIANSPDRLKMYERDYKAFSEACRGDFSLLEPMWDCLDDLLTPSVSMRAQVKDEDLIDIDIEL